MSFSLGDHEFEDLRQRAEKALGLTPFGVVARLNIQAELLKRLLDDHEDGVKALGKVEGMSSELNDLRDVDKENDRLSKRVERLEGLLVDAGIALPPEEEGAATEEADEV